jgi:hypothetical protein
VPLLLLQPRTKGRPVRDEPARRVAAAGRNIDDARYGCLSQGCAQNVDLEIGAKRRGVLFARLPRDVGEVLAVGILWELPGELQQLIPVNPTAAERDLFNTTHPKRLPGFKGADKLPGLDQ